jgi:DNA-binding response OmpR family regulator
MAKKIMIVDDNSEIAETIRIILDKKGYNTQLAKDGSDFLAKVKAYNPDIVLLDIMMPGLTTQQILQTMRETGLGSLKVILVSVLRFTDQEKKKLFDQFPNLIDHIAKPFNISDLVTKVKNQIGE